MAERVIRETVSDVSGSVIAEAEAYRVHVNHPEMPDAPTVRIDVTAEEAEALRKLSSPAVRAVLFAPGGEEVLGEDLTLPVAKFNALFKPLGKTAAEVLIEAPVVGKKAKTPNGNGHGEEERDYSSLEWAGTSKKGKTSQAEREFVAGNFTAVNERLKRDGMRTLDLNNAEHVVRYGLGALAEAAKANGGVLPPELAGKSLAELEGRTEEPQAAAGEAPVQ